MRAWRKGVVFCCMDDTPDKTPLSNVERLAAALPEEGIARDLLNAWTNGDPADRQARMLRVAQPETPQDADDAPTD